MIVLIIIGVLLLIFALVNWEQSEGFFRRLFNPERKRLEYDDHSKDEAEKEDDYSSDEDYAYDDDSDYAYDKPTANEN